MTKICGPSSLRGLHHRSWRLRAEMVLLGLLVVGVCKADQRSGLSAGVAAATDVAGDSVKPKELRMWMTVGTQRFAITLADTEAARAFAARSPLTLEMTDLNGNEKKFDLPMSLPANASRPGTIRNGDLMLYGSNTVVLFYLTFDSSYSYTRLGRVDDPTGLAQVLGRRDVTVKFSVN